MANSENPQAVLSATLGNLVNYLIRDKKVNIPVIFDLQNKDQIHTLTVVFSAASKPVEEKKPVKDPNQPELPFNGEKKPEKQPGEAVTEDTAEKAEIKQEEEPNITDDLDAYIEWNISPK